MLSTMIFVSTILSVLMAVLGSSIPTTPIDQYPVCDSLIYCTGDLLETIQMAQLDSDSKTFVDKKLKQPEAETYAIFEQWKLDNPSPTVDQIRTFVNDNFDPEGSEFQAYTPTDYVAEPAILKRISDLTYRQFAADLNAMWPQLGRNMTDDVANHPELYSIIHVPNPVIVPGGRFREFYYWDSYWIVMGLLHSEMYTTVRGMLSNFVSMVDRFGFVPNGGRIYYLGRSQPPLLIPMIKQYVDATGDWAFVRDALPTLEREFDYWFNEQKSVQVRGHRLSHYSDRGTGPRPESYSEDRLVADTLPANQTTQQTTQDVYARIRATAESGMDFSTRWFEQPEDDNATLLDLRTPSIVPVDLNSMLFGNAELLGEWFDKMGNSSASKFYANEASKLKTAIQAVFWNETVGSWLDWSLLDGGGHRDYFVPSNLAPLWMGAYEKRKSHSISRKVLAYLEQTGAMDYVGGVPNTLFYSGEQWDYPNAWPPMQHILVVGLDGLGTTKAKELARNLAAKWVNTNYVTYKQTQVMFEKYSALVVGEGGDGGEYEVVTGFGWTNGVVLDLLSRYGRQLKYEGKTRRKRSYA